MSDLPGFESVYGEGPARPREEPSFRLKPINRNQLLLRPVDVEKLVPADHEVRAIWEFAGHIDLTAYYQDIKAVEGRAGSTAFDPRLLISAWVYSYAKGIGSAREISRLCDCDPAYRWLTGCEPIGYHTLSNFRSTHKEALDGLFVNVLGVLSNEGLVTLEQVMHDGMKVKACAGSDSFRREDKLKAHLDAAREQVKRLKESPDEEVGPRMQKAQERAALEKEERLERAFLELAKIRETKSSPGDRENARVSITDPEARIMKGPGGGFGPAYNIQISTDSANSIIVAAAPSQRGDDYRELVPAIDRIVSMST
jgi:transposase